MDFIFPRTKTPPLERLRKTSESPYAIHVCRIDFGFNTYGTPSADDKLDIENLTSCHSSVIAKFNNLKSLHFEDPPPSLSQPQVAAYMDTVVSILLDVPLVNLEDLDIWLSDRKEFERFFSNKGDFDSLHKSIENLMPRLRHLGLTIDARTNTSKQKDSDINEPDLTPLMTALLNISDPSSYVFTILESARNLKTLEVSSAEVLNIDNVNFPPSLRLRFLSLAGVSVSANKLVSLVHQSMDDIRHISFHEVQLNSETWEDVIWRLTCVSPHLIDIYIQLCGYSITGLSSAFHERPDLGKMAWSEGFLPHFETNHHRDLLALGHLQREVNLRRDVVGLEPFSVSEYQYLGLELEA